MLPTIIIRHRKENLNKCSLKGLESLQEFLFIKYPMKEPLCDLSQYIVLSMDAPPLSFKEKDKGIVLIDATWNYSQKMIQTLPANLVYRSIPGQYQTAYPRKQTGCSNPSTGLASIEALFLAYHILGRKNDHLLDHYYWKEPFLQKNHLS